MREEKIFVKNGNLIIETLFGRASEEKAVVICHPHSLMGGSMYNNVVEAIQEAFATENYSTLRFNFRGVGASTGVYDEGVGEKEDVLAVCDYLKETGMTKIYFAGYSFGAWVGSKVIAQNDKNFFLNILVSPPIDYFEFEWGKLKNKINLLICGNSDQFCDSDTLINKARKINSPVEIINGADHFYMGKEKELKAVFDKIFIE